METEQIEIRKTENTVLKFMGKEQYKFVVYYKEENTGAISYIEMQNGPIKENGVNGLQNEDLIAICVDRLQRFQQGDFKCRENAIAITKLEEALLWLDKRTQDRINRGVEGTNEQ